MAQPLLKRYAMAVTGDDMRRQIRVGIGVAFGFAAGAVLANAVLEGKMDWAATASLGLVLVVGGVIGFAIGCLVERSLGHRLRATRTPAWILLSFASGCVFMATFLAAFWDAEGLIFFGISAGGAAFGVWNGLLLGTAFGIDGRRRP